MRLYISGPRCLAALEILRGLMIYKHTEWKHWKFMIMNVISNDFPFKNLSGSVVCVNDSVGKTANRTFLLFHVCRCKDRWNVLRSW